MPGWRGPAYGLAGSGAAVPGDIQLPWRRAWRDDERDADADGLSNWLESARGPGHASWWAGFWNSRPTRPSPGTEAGDVCGQEFGAFNKRPFADLDLADPDVDGDTLLDGEDDQDNDDVTNIRELYEIDGDLRRRRRGSPARPSTYPSIDMDPSAGVDTWGVNAFNPCAPDPELAHLRGLQALLAVPPSSPSSNLAPAPS